MEHLVGNKGKLEQIKSWIRAWQVTPSGGDKDHKRAVLISGPPGIGKTTAARVVLQGFGFDVVELNASDARSKKALQTCAEDLVGNTSIADFAAGGAPRTPLTAAALLAPVPGRPPGAVSCRNQCPRAAPAAPPPS